MPDETPPVQIVFAALPAMPPARVAASLALVCGTGLPVLAVAGPHHADLVRRQLEAANIVELRDPDRACMATCMREGVLTRPHAANWVLLPGDAARVDVDTVPALVEALADHPIVCMLAAGRRCYPVAFAAELFADLMGLEHDEHLRRLLARYPSGAVARSDATSTGFALTQIQPP